MFKSDGAATSDLFDNINLAGNLMGPTDTYANFYTYLANELASAGYYHYKGGLTTPTCD